MSTLYLGADLHTLADRLSAVQAMAVNDFFTPVTVAVATPQMSKWLRLRLARKQGVVINYQFKRFEKLMWDLLREVDRRKHPLPVELVNGNSYRLMILSLLLDLEAGGADLDPLRAHLQREGVEPRRDVCRRAWQLAGRLGDLIREYEYHRQDQLIQKWLRGQDGYPRDPALPLERSQRVLFQLITKETDGLRAVLGQRSRKLFKTLPQYAHEVMELGENELAAPSRRTIHLFGITQISAMHIKVLHWLGKRFDLRLYYLNPLVSRMVWKPLAGGLEEAAWSDAPKVRTAMQALANRLREPSRGDAEGAENDQLLRAWGRAGAESLLSMADLLRSPGPFDVQVLGAVGGMVSHPLTARSSKATKRIQKSMASGAGSLFRSVLTSLQDCLLGTCAAAEPKLAQDRSVQIVACPGMYREVETVYNSILHNLKEDSTLKQTDIAVLVSDMQRYRPVIQSVFDRKPGLLHYNLADFSAAGLSAFGQGVVGLFDLALESFTRSRVFGVLLNPCFLARLGVEREQALTWLEWAEELGIYHCWDATDKQERGYANSSLYSWELGLRRLRLGRLMDAGEGRSNTPAPAYHDVVPFANLASSDKEQLDAFCRAAQGLLPTLSRLRSVKLSGGRWASELRRVIDTFLDVPDDRPAEAEVRDALFRTLTELKYLDLLAGAEQRQPALPLSLMREFVADNLEFVEGQRGDLLTAGVSISALKPLRPIPFRIIYILGLGEGLFPGSDALSTFDLHSRERRPGDIRQAEGNRFLLLEELLAARDKIYLLYNSRDLQKDQTLHPCGPLNQLRRWISQTILQGEFEITRVPLNGADLRCLGHLQSEATDALISYDQTERLQALSAARRDGALQLDGAQQAELDRRLNNAMPRFALPVDADAAEMKTPTISLWELRGFLQAPEEAALKRHLHLQDDDEPEIADDEPFCATFPSNYRLITSTLQDFVERALKGTVPEALQTWPQRFAQLYEEYRLRGQLPDGAFADIDRARFDQDLRECIEGTEGLAQFVEARRHLEFCGPVLLGESLIPVGARQRFPALKLTPPAEARIVGTLPLAWRSPEAFEILVLSGMSKELSGDDICKPLLEPFLFFLALKAGTEAGDGECSAEWLGSRNFLVHVLHRGGVTGFEYAADDISAEQARTYLTGLVGEFLNRKSFEVLPFPLIIKHDELKQAYTLDEAGPELESLRERYRQQLADCLEQDQENEEHPAYRPTELVQMVDLDIPPDAFDKVRRRFRLIDRGPARLRDRGGKRA